MKILGVGLSRTGTYSLAQALYVLGYKTIHWAPERLRDIIDGTNTNPDFKRYNDVDAVTDLPAALFYRELHEAYPDCGFILTVRNIDDWFSSIKLHYESRVPSNLRDQPEMLAEARATQMLAYGSDVVSEYIYKKRYLDHNQNVLNEYPKTLVINIPAGDGWGKLCPYLDKPVPDQDFPRINMTPKSY